MKNRAALIAEIDPAELAVRMCESSYGLKRPPNTTAIDALAAMEEDCRDGWIRAANTALHYIQERLAAAQPPH